MTRYIHSCPLRWADMDANGHVNNAVYAVYLEDVRFRMFSELIPDDPSERLASNFVVHEQTLRFVRPLVYRSEPATIEAWVENVRGASITLCCEIKDGEDVYVASRSVIAAFDSNTGRVRRFSEHERNVLTSYAT
ncbi:hypothetical protein AV521_00755 [Streptomyces sp. IMTB 2501]|uniref:acyl-CoA thioesterase n=1 Tax=Streptomyces sp. IMTB 2501 TaxID=1776340 RepID=UPI00096C6694|nr:thioesterase family protein [Streptomyces sp. IMTB 2501]OLZ74257.1 hypothetical protein AV521_00755 [Streptomyces sp. IMTB 2501]